MTKNDLNYNGFNIRYDKNNHWIGQLAPYHGFCTFVSLRHGFRAYWLILSSYYKQGLHTVRQIVSRYAPPSENNTSHYVAFVSTRVFGSPYKCDVCLTTVHQYQLLAAAMFSFESGRNLTSVEFFHLCSCMHLYFAPYKNLK